IQDLRMQLKQESGKSKKGGSKALQLSTIIEQLEDQLSARKDELRPMLIDQYNAARGDSGSQALPLAEQEFDALKKDLESINDEIKKRSEDLEKLSTFSADVSARQDDLSSLHEL